MLIKFTSGIENSKHWKLSYKAYTSAKVHSFLNFESACLAF